jgi:hypothetical protein
MVTLVRDDLSKDVIEFFEQLLAAAKSGQVAGAVIGVALRGRRYIVNSCGTLSRDPTLARGVTAALDDELARMVHSRVDSDTTL